ncbi:DUF2796 domain-containing protein [Pseudothauera nasutitermitis]|nr:DUF2796 domain-containing protein [Pseudothauera nasutitermitis]
MKGVIAASFLLGFASLAQAHGAHEHGVADLRVAVEGGELSIELSTPLDNLVGFEHAPRTDAQRKAVAEAEARLRDFSALFVLPAAARCEVKDIELESPWHEAEHDHDHKHEQAHAHDHKHDDGHEHDAGHGDLHAHYELSCAVPQALNEVQVRLGEVFPRMTRVRAETATPNGQNAATLDKTRNRLPL